MMTQLTNQDEPIFINKYLPHNFLAEKMVLIELLSQIPNLIYLEEYLTLINDKFIRRSLIQLGYKLINSGYVTNIPLEKILNEFEINLIMLRKKTEKDKENSIKNFI